MYSEKIVQKDRLHWHSNDMLKINGNNGKGMIWVFKQVKGVKGWYDALNWE